jgi:hypothetical protein
MLVNAMIIAVLMTSAIALTAQAAERSPYVAPKGKALIVFVRNGRASKEAPFVIFDKDGKCVAVHGEEDSELIPVEAGKHTLYTMSYNIKRMEFDVAAGRTYFVEIVLPRYGAGTIKVSMAKRDSEAFKEVKSWVKGKATSDPKGDVCRGAEMQSSLEGSKRASKRGTTARFDRKIETADEKWKAADDAYRAKWTMSKRDGFTEEEAKTL